MLTICELSPFFHPLTAHQVVVHMIVFVRKAFIVLKFVIRVDVIFASLLLVLGQVFIILLKGCTKVESLVQFAVKELVLIH